MISVTHQSSLKKRNMWRVAYGVAAVMRKTKKYVASVVCEGINGVTAAVQYGGVKALIKRQHPSMASKRNMASIMAYRGKLCGQRRNMVA